MERKKNETFSAPRKHDIFYLTRDCTLGEARRVFVFRPTREKEVAQTGLHINHITLHSFFQSFPGIKHSLWFVAGVLMQLPCFMLITYVTEKYFQRKFGYQNVVNAVHSLKVVQKTVHRSVHYSL